MTDNNTPLLDLAIMAETKAVMGGKLSQMICYFIEDSEMYLNAIRQGINDNSAAKIVSPAHTIKSSSRQLGALRMSEIGKEIEHLARDQVAAETNDMHPFQPLFNTLETAFNETKPLLDPFTQS